MLSSLALAGCIETTTVGRPIAAIAADPIPGIPESAGAGAPSRILHESLPFDTWAEADIAGTVREALERQRTRMRVPRGWPGNALRDVDLTWTGGDEVRVEGTPVTLPPQREGGK